MNSNSAASNLLEILQCEESLYTFVKHAWPAIEGNNPFIPNWHLEAICEHLEAATRGEISKLIISVPPRTTKTTIVSIMWPAWVWATRPNVKFLFSSYAQKISWEHSRLCRMLIESPWYQERWGHVFKLSKDQTTKGHFTNTSLGHRIATSVGAGGTALGGDILVCLLGSCYIETDFGKIPIGEIVENELKVKVASYSHDFELMEFKEIEKYEKRVSEEIFEIEFDDGSILECTGNHPIYIDGKGYVIAEFIQEGDVSWSLNV